MSVTDPVNCFKSLVLRERVDCAEPNLDVDHVELKLPAQEEDMCLNACTTLTWRTSVTNVTPRCSVIDQTQTIYMVLQL